MTEITVDELTYSGSDLATAVQGEMGDGRTPSHLRLEAFVDTDELRDPYLMTATPGQIEADLSVGRAWHMTRHASFALFAVPNEGMSPQNPDPTVPYYQKTDEFLGSATIRPGDATPADLAFGDDLQLHFTGSSGPGAQRENGALKRTPAIHSAITDFEADADDGLDFVAKSHVTAVMDNLTSRIDRTGVDGGPDGYPDGAVDAVDQNDHGYCAGASLLFNFSQYYPRRIVEICRSLYQPIVHRTPAFCGYLTRSVTFTESPTYLKNFYLLQRNRHGRTEREAFVDILQHMIRETLTHVRVHHDDVEDDPNDSQGMNAAESRAMMKELVNPSNTATSSPRSLSRGGVEPLRFAKDAVDDDNMNTIALDAGLVDPNVTLPKDVSVDHAITLLDSNVPPATQGAATVPDPIEIVFQNSWGGKAERQTHPKADIKKYVAHATVGEP